MIKKDKDVIWNHWQQQQQQKKTCIPRCQGSDVPVLNEFFYIHDKIYITFLIVLKLQRH